MNKILIPSALAGLIVCLSINSAHAGTYGLAAAPSIWTNPETGDADLFVPDGTITYKYDDFFEVASGNGGTASVTAAFAGDLGDYGITASASASAPNAGQSGIVYSEYPEIYVSQIYEWNEVSVADLPTIYTTTVTAEIGHVGEASSGSAAGSAAFAAQDSVGLYATNSSPDVTATNSATKIVNGIDTKSHISSPDEEHLSTVSTAGSYGPVAQATGTVLINSEAAGPSAAASLAAHVSFGSIGLSNQGL